MVLITNPRMAVRREVCWILSNIAAGSGGRFMQVLENNLYFEQILTIAQTDATEVLLSIVISKPPRSEEKLCGCLGIQSTRMPLKNLMLKLKSKF